MASASTWSPMPEYLWIACSTSLAVATRGRTSRPVIERMSSSAYMFAGSDIATRSFPSSLTDRDRSVAPAQCLGEQRRRRRIDPVFRQVDELEPDLLGERAHQIALADVAQVDQHAPERLRRVPMLLERTVQLLLREQALLEQDLAELLRLLLLRHHVELRPLVLGGLSIGTVFVVLKQLRELSRQ